MHTSVLICVTRVGPKHTGWAAGAGYTADFSRGANPRPVLRMRPRMAMNGALHKIVNLLRAR